VTVPLHQLTAALYLIAGIVAALAAAVPLPRLGRVAVRLLVLAVVIHLVAFAALHGAEPPASLTDLPVAVSFMAWMAALSFLMLLRRAQITRLVVVIAPVAFLGAFYTALSLPSSAPPPAAGGGSWPHAHVLLGSAGLSLLGLAALASLLFLTEHRRLKAKRPARPRLPLPSLEALDRANVAALTVGFPLLTLSVITGALWEQTASGQLWAATAHQTWSLIAWAVYAVLVAVRFGANQGSRQAAVSTVGGFTFLFFAVIGVELFV
jgi:ABC-type transport system involved in cytochrome c biogenesis permease subunit